MNILDGNVLDVVIALTLVAGFARGLWTGLEQQLWDVLSALVALSVAALMMHQVSEWITVRPPPNPVLPLVVSFIFTFVLLFFMSNALVHSYRRPVFKNTPSLAHRIVGGGVGLLVAVLLLSITFTALEQTGVPNRTMRERAVLYAPTARFTPTAWEAAAEVLPIGSLLGRFDPTGTGKWRAS